jgi:hypothetical protein
MSKIEYGFLSEEGAVLKSAHPVEEIFRSGRRGVWRKWLNGHLVETIFLGRGTTFPPDWEIPGVVWFQTLISSGSSPDGLTVANGWVCTYCDNIEEAAVQYRAAVKFAETLPPAPRALRR